MSSVLGMNIRSAKNDIIRQISRYEIHFENFFDCQELSDCFQEYLRKIRNIEPYSFLKEIERFVTYVGSKARYAAAARIIREYVDTITATKEVNIGHKARNKVIEEFKTCNEADCPVNLFDEVRLSVYLELKVDCLNNFVNTEGFLTFLQDKLKQNPDYLQRIGVLKTNKESDDTSTDEESVGTPVTLSRIYDASVTLTDQDFEGFVEEMFDPSKWQLISKIGELSFSLSKSKHYSKKRGIKKMLETGVVPYTQIEVFNGMHSKEFAKIQDSAFTYDVLDYIDFGKYAGGLIHVKVKLKFPLMDRDFVFLTSAKRLENGDILIVRKSVQENSYLTDKHIRAFSFSGSLLRKIDEKNTRYYILSFTDLMGWFTPKLFNMTLKYKNTEWHERLLETLKIRSGPDAIDAGVEPIPKSLTHYEKFMSEL
ncbi:cytochrome P450 [Acrasis kona]|uniref:Cytochrome P450 n=1 Tax=Acrasis kona TaxID=1008807 RepID=A0AAW2ZT58_9EUKA